MLSETRETVTLTVEDNGKGIKREHFENIFQTSSATTKRAIKRTGIGLTLTKSLVEMHHGTIEVESTENELNPFTIRLLKGSAHFNESELHHDRRNRKP